MAVYYDTQIITHQAAYAIIANWILSKLKSISWIPFFNRNSYYVNKWSAILIALATSLGIGYSYSYDSSGLLNIQISGLLLASIWDKFLSFILSYGMQQGIYHTVTKEDYSANANMNKEGEKK